MVKDIGVVTVVKPTLLKQHCYRLEHVVQIAGLLVEEEKEEKKKRRKRKKKRKRRRRGGREERVGLQFDYAAYFRCP